MLTHKATGRDDRPLCGGKGHASVIDALVTCQRCRLRLASPTSKPRTKHDREAHPAAMKAAEAEVRAQTAHITVPDFAPSAIHKTPAPYCSTCGQRSGHWPGCKEDS